MRLGGWSDYKIMHEIYTHLAARGLNVRAREMENFFKKIYDRRRTDIVCKFVCKIAGKHRSEPYAKNYNRTYKFCAENAQVH